MNENFGCSTHSPKFGVVNVPDFDHSNDSISLWFLKVQYDHHHLNNQISVLRIINYLKGDIKYHHSVTLKY